VTVDAHAPSTGEAAERRPDEPAEDRPTRRFPPSRIAVTVVVLVLLSMWGYVLFLALGPGRQPLVGRLADPAFAHAAEKRCAAALDQVDKLPVASASHTAVERSDVLDRANAIYAAMLDDLDGLEHLAPAGDQRDRAHQWLTDWRTYLGDREDYADALRRDPKARLLVSEEPGTGEQTTEWIDDFALANDASSCASPTDA
jgi:hypothetical protein